MSERVIPPRSFMGGGSTDIPDLTPGSGARVSGSERDPLRESVDPPVETIASNAGVLM